MNSIWDQIRQFFKEGGALNQLIMINLGVYVVFLLLRILSFLFQVNISGFFIDYMALPSDLTKLITRPWSLLTYMFLHQGFIHILFNMLWLYFGGRLFLEYFGGRRLIATYLLGGLIGGAIYILAYNLFPAFSDVVSISNNRGASAGVMAIIFAIATYNPRFPVRLLVLSFPLWGVAVFALITDLIALGEGNNPGGSLAHLGGAAFGYFMARAYSQGKDLTEGFAGIIDRFVNLFKPKSNLRKVYSNVDSAPRSRSPRKTANQEEDKLNAILEKISQSGYDSLSKEEKDHLFKFGKD